MSETEFRTNELEFCPICQIPLKLLKIIYTVHISMCDVLWNELPDCSDGIECSNANVFHYRDFSHEVLANHRENIRKRKIEELNNTDNVNHDSESKNKLKKVKGCQDSANYENENSENEDDIFISLDSRKISNERSQVSKIKTNKRLKSGKNIVKCSSQKQKIKENVSDPQQSIKTEETNVIIEKELVENNRVPDEEINVSVKEELLQNTSKDEKMQNDSMMSGHSRDSSIMIDTDTHDDVSFKLSFWKNVEEEINENVEKKEKCKAQWNNLFKGNLTTTVNETEVSSKGKNKKHNLFHSVKDNKICPSFKKMPGTGFAVDAFQFGNIPGVTTYFLTHFHSDHYIGLKKSFSNPIYCSLITANLVKKKLRVDEKYLRVLELNQPVIINRVEVTFFDANHCPGSVLILFRLINGEQFLHVGDFRACIEMENIPELQNSHIDRLYLDTTYFNPQYVFPTQEEVVERVKNIVRNKSKKYEKALFISGTYLIGKEKVFIGMLEELKCKLWAQPPKVDVFRCINNPIILSALTSVPEEAKVHVLPMNYLRFDKLQKYLLDLNGAFTHIFAFKPTGWEMGRSVSGDWVNESSNGNVTIFGVPYSEHSNFEELCRFVKFIKADKVIPTVTMKNRDMYGILKSLVDSYKVGAKQQNIQQFFNSSSKTK